MGYTTYSQNGYNTYREIGVKTASQGKLVVMLYDGAISHLKSAINMINESSRIKAENIESFGTHLQKTQDIITELEMTLNMDNGGEIAKNLMALYIYFNKEILKASMSHDRKALESVQDFMSKLRDSWESAANTQANGTVGAGMQSIVIDG